MSNIKKLIENGGWRPVEEAPKDGAVYLARDEFGGIEVVKWGELPTKAHCDFAPAWVGIWGEATFIREPTHFMPLDTPERMAKVIKEQYETIEILRNRLSIYDCQEQVDESDTLAHLQEAYVYACEALATINKVAGGEDV